MPIIPKQKEKFDAEPKYSGVDLLPKTIKQQREEVKATKGVSIKITKPRLTINGFVVENTAPSAKEST